MREAEGGVFTPHGYVVQNGEIRSVYIFVIVQAKGLTAGLQ